MKIVPTFDSTVTPSLQYYRNAVNYVIKLFNTSFETNIEIDITFGFLPFTGGKGVSRNFAPLNGFNYAVLYAQLQDTSPDSHIAAGRLPTTDPTSGGVFQLTTALQKAYGITSFAGSDGTVELNANVNWSTNYTSPPPSGLFDTASAIAHEISEVMGRLGHCGVTTNSNGSRIFGPMDLFRFQAPGVLNVNAGPANYSLAGHNLQLAFNDPSTSPTKDPADWNQTGDCFGDFSPGVHNGFSGTDYLTLRGLGYLGVAAPAPIFAI